MDDNDPPSHRQASESDFLTAIEDVLTRTGHAPDLTDDCGAPPCSTALVTTDALVAGVHFDLERDSLGQIGAQAAVANLSDLAGSGGAAGWLVWSLLLPERWSPAQVAAITEGFATTAAVHGAHVIGGNLSRTPGPLTIDVTAGGPLAGARRLRRDGARPDDDVFITGPLGDAALGIAEPDVETRTARHGWRPHLAEAAALAADPSVTAAMDISDGLLLDAGRLAHASRVSIDIASAAVPTSALYRTRRGDDRALALSGGEDYVLLFTATRPPQALTGHVWRIGRCLPGHGIHLDGRPVAPTGHDHFARRPPEAAP